MASTFFGLTIGTSGLFASKTGLNTTAHNIANVETEGYSRQTVNQTADSALQTHNRYGMLGTGANVNSIEQQRSLYYDEKFRSNSAIAGLYTQRNYFMGEIEGYLNEIELEGFTTSFNNMFNAMQELAKDPSSLTVRTQATNYAQSMCEYFNSLYTNLQSIQQECNYEVKNAVQKINSYANQIATLTKQINTVEVGGENANDLRDQRNLLVDSLSQIANITVTERPIGNAGMSSYVIKLDSNTIVDTYEVNELTCIPRTTKTNLCDVDGLYDIYWTNGQQLGIGASLTGSLKALFEVRDGNNDEDLTGVTQVAKGEKVVKMTGASINNMTDLNIPLEGTIRLGNGMYTYSKYDIEVVNGKFEYTFYLNEETRKTYAIDTLVSVGSDINYKGIPYYMAQLNQFVRVFAKEFNDVHNQGVDLNGQPGRNFFTGFNSVTGDQYDLLSFGAEGDKYSFDYDAAPTSVPYYMLTAQNFKVSDWLMADSAHFATTPSLESGVENNKIIQDLIALKGDVNMFTQGSPAAFLQTLVSDIGIDTKSAKDASKSQENIVASVANQRLSVSGVDSDEEAMALARYQEAYSLNAKVIQVMQQIYDKLINETGL